MKSTCYYTDAFLRVFIGLMLAALAIGCGCSRGKSGGHGFWRPTGNDLADRINDTLNMNQHWLNRDSDRLNYARRLDSIGRSENNRQIMARAAYWESACLENMMDEGPDIDSLINRAYTLCDSARYPYDWARISMNFVSDKFSPDGFRREVKAACYMKNAGDTLNWAVALTPVVYDLTLSGDTVNAHKVEDKQMLLFKKLGFSPGVWNCRYNRFIDDYYFNYNNGDKRGDELADSLMADDQFKYAGFQKSFIYLFKYRVTGKKEWLGLAWEEAEQFDDGGGVRSVIAGEIAKRLLKDGETGKAGKYIRVFREILQDETQLKPWENGDVDYEILPGERRDVYKLGIEIYDMLNRRDSADIFRRWQSMYQIMRENLNQTANMHRSLLGDDDYMLHDLIGEEDDDTVAETDKSKIYIGLTCSVAIMLAALGAYAIYRKKRERVNAVAEKNVDNSGAENEPCHISADMNKENDDKALEISGKIRAEINLDRQWEDVEGLFAKYAPHFRIRLKEKFPDITIGESRMACLVVIGLDNKQISRLLSINPESAKKNRLRLRQRLGISNSSDMEKMLLDFLR